MEKDKVDIGQIRQYVRGELSPREMYALERRAQEDPMLMDIILGLESVPEGAHASNLSDIRNRIAQRTKNQKDIRRLAPFQRWAIAASVLVALTFSIRWFMQDFPEETHPEIASLSAPAEEQQVSSSIVHEPKEKQAETKDTPLRTPRATVAEKKQDAPIQASKVTVSEEKSANPTPKRLALDEAEKVEERSPLSTAALRYERDATPQLSVDTSEGPKPVNGWEAYDRYLKQEAIHPGKRTGSVMLRFDIDDESTPTNIEVVQTTNSLLDSQAIELVRKGPKWRLGKKREREAKVSIVFGNP